MRFKLSNWLIMLLFVPVWCLAVVIKPEAPEFYRVKTGDTLWDISALYLEQPWLWPELWRNNSHITNPHLIYPGDELRLVFNEQGEAELVLARETPDKPQKKLSPQGRLMDKSRTPVPVLPWSVIAPFVKDAVVISPDDYEALPKLLTDYDDTARYANEDLLIGEPADNSEQLLAVRQYGTIYDMQGQKVGVQVRNLASASLVPSENRDFTLVRLDESRMEARAGDRLAPASILHQGQDIQLRSADRERGYILDNLQEHKLMGRLDVVVIDLGQHQVTPGTVMGIYSLGPAVKGDKAVSDKNWLAGIFDDEQAPQPPAVKSGELVVFKTFERTSYALILNSSKVIRRGAIIAKP